MPIAIIFDYVPYLSSLRVDSDLHRSMLLNAIRVDVANYLAILNALSREAHRPELSTLLDTLERYSYVAIPLPANSLVKRRSVVIEALRNLGAEPLRREDVLTIDASLLLISVKTLLETHPRASPYLLALEASEIAELAYRS